MLKNVNKIETNKYELTISANAEEFETAIQATYNKKKNKIAVPGFRKGKAPRKMIEKLYGENVFFEDAVNSMVPVLLATAFKEANIIPVNEPALQLESMTKAEGFTLKATVVGKPEVKIADYKGIEIKKETKEITDEDVNKEIDRIRERQGRLVTVEGRAVENGDTVVIDFEGFKDGVAFEGGKENNYELKIGAGYFIPGFEEQVIGHNAGEEFTINVTFPENYQMTELAGQPAEFKIKLHEIKAIELPEVDDEFVKDVSEFDTLDEFKAETKKSLQERADKNAETDATNKLYDAVVEKLEAEIPNEMYENKIDEMVREFEARLSQQGLNLETYLQYMGMEMEGFKKTFEERAQKEVKLRLALEKIAEIEGLTTTDDAVEEEMQKLADMYKMSVAQVKRYVPFEGVKQDLIVEAAAKLVKDNAKID